jgi:thioester reductase-like protein
MPMSPLHALSETESVILSAAAASLRLPLAPEHVLEPLSLLGADSLGICELAAAIEQTCGVVLPEGLAHESATIRELAAWVETRRMAAPDHPREPDQFDQMLADSRLPHDVRPGVTGSEVALEDGRAVLLTGATGFLGASLAAALLARSEATLYCAVRGGLEAGSQRLRRRLIENGVSPATIAARIEMVDADLTRPHLGLNVGRWARLGCTVDRILHAGACVSWVSAYPTLRRANVLGTLELLRLASRGAIPFHFVSSLSVCYAVDGPARVDEAFDPLPHLRGVHLGYAQSKIVAEALVREAGRRGLPIRIYRPSLISGHSVTGAFNADDLLSFLVRGCVRMGTAPDLDWSLDCLPVDTVAGAILGLSRCGAPTTHLMHDRPRHWRECLLWMRLAGYRVRLVPYSEWVQQLARDTLQCADHPLRPLRAFFLGRPARGLTLPELYEDGRRSRAAADRTAARLDAYGRFPALDASLLARYFAAYRAAGHLPPPASGGGSGPPRTSTPDFDGPFFEGALAARGEVVRIRAATCLSAGSAHSIISELTAWRCGQPAGLFRYRLDIETTSGRQSRDVVLKLKPHADEATAVGEALARLCSARVGNAYARWSDRVGLAGSHLRERALYESADTRLARHMPALLGVADLGARGGCALVIEDLSGAAMIDSIDRTPWWDPPHIEIAVSGLARIHAAWQGRTAALRELPWAGFIHSTGSMTAMSELWRALADDAAPAFGRWGGGELPDLHRMLVDSIPSWRPVLDDGPHTLIHNDCNPRNLCIRKAAEGQALCAYDWELATQGLPQRDLAELLCFVLPDSTSDATIEFWVERHRAGLEHAAGLAVESVQWRRGFAAALNELLVTRLAIYALVHRVRRQSFLPRVVASWRRLHEWAAVDR